MSSQVVRFGFVTWDWRESIDVRAVNNILKEIHGPVAFADIETGSDCYAAAIHSIPSTFTDDEWRKLWETSDYNPFVRFVVAAAKEHELFEGDEDALRQCMDMIFKDNE